MLGGHAKQQAQSVGAACQSEGASNKDAPGLALLMPPLPVTFPVLAAISAAVPVTAVPPPLLLVTAAALALSAALAPSWPVTAA